MNLLTKVGLFLAVFFAVLVLVKIVAVFSWFLAATVAAFTVYKFSTRYARV